MLRDYWYTAHGRDFFPGAVLCSALKIINASDAIVRISDKEDIHDAIGTVMKE